MTLVVTLALLAGGCADNGTMSPTSPPPEPQEQEAEAVELASVLVASGLDQPLDVQAPPGDPRLFIVEQTGRIKIVRDGQLLATPFLDISDRVRVGPNAACWG